MAEETQHETAPAQPVAWRSLTEPIDDDACTVYMNTDKTSHLTLGAIVQDRDSLWKQLEAAKTTLETRDREVAALQKAVGDRTSKLLTQSDRIEALEKQNREQDSKAQGLTVSVRELTGKLAVAQHIVETALPEMQRLPDGSLRLMISVPEEQAIPLLSWADSAGEDPQSYIQKNVEEALLAVVSS